MFYSNMPKLDLHGETKDSARVLVNEFINDNYKLGYADLVIIHGIGEGILRKEVHVILKNNKFVLDYKLDNFNIGCTLVRLVDKKPKKCYNTAQM